MCCLWCGVVWCGVVQFVLLCCVVWCSLLCCVMWCSLLCGVVRFSMLLAHAHQILFVSQDAMRSGIYWDDLFCTYVYVRFSNSSRNLTSVSHWLTFLTAIILYFQPLLLAVSESKITQRGTGWEFPISWEKDACHRYIFLQTSELYLWFQLKLIDF